MAHTPPPWRPLWHLLRAQPSGAPSFYQELSIADGDNVEIARLPVTHPKLVDNAALITAAPYLLTACHLLCELIDNDVHDADTRWKQAKNMIRDAVKKAQNTDELIELRNLYMPRSPQESAAIAKAEGRE